MLILDFDCNLHRLEENEISAFAEIINKTPSFHFSLMMIRNKKATVIYILKRQLIFCQKSHLFDGRPTGEI